MKKLITYLKALWRRGLDSQKSDMRHDCRLTVGSPSGLDAKWKQNPFMRYAVVLTLIFTIGSGNVWGGTATITEDFEKQSAGTTYNSTQTYTGANSNVGIAWFVEHGTVSTTSYLDDSQSMHMRAYYAKSSASGTWNGNLPYVNSTTDVKGLISITFNAAVSNTGLKMDVMYSTNSGSSWSYMYKTSASSGTNASAITFSNTSKASYTYYIPSAALSPTGNFRIKIAVNSSSTHTNKPGSAGNYTFRVDNIAFTYTAYTVTYNGNDNTSGSVPTDATKYLSGETVTVKSNSGSLAKTGYTFSGWNTNASGTGTNYTAGSGTFSITSDITLFAKWVAAGTSVSLSKGSETKGTFSLSTSSVTTTSSAQTVTVTCTPDAGYYVSAISATNPATCPSAITYGGSNNSRTVTYPTGANGTSTISVTFSPIWYLKGSFNTWGETNPCTVADGIATATVSLAKNTKYEFQFYDKQNNTWYYNVGNIVEDISGWTFTGGTGSNCKIFTGKAGTYTFKINTSTKAVQVIYQAPSHPDDAYVYFKKWADWSDNYFVHWWDGSGNTVQDYNSAIRVTKTYSTCDNDYVCFPILADYTNFLVKDAASGDGSHKSGDLTSNSNAAKYYDFESWKNFTTYEINFGGNGNTGGEMSSITDLCPGAEQALTSNAFTKTHYSFSCWHADVAVKVGESTISAGGDITNGATIKDIQSDINLTAQWSPVSYTITKTFANVANAGLPASFTYTGATTTALNSSFTVDGTNFFLPSSIAVTMGGTPLTQGTHYTYNNSTGAFTFDVAITGNIVITATAVPKLKSIAITAQPTTRKYLVGDVFSSTGAVVTATMGDGNTKTVSATWTPSSALSAGTGQTVTASYTENGINQTATTTIDVYSVTVNKVNMSGTAITNASVTATCSGRTLSQSVSTTNYKFNSWNVTAGGVTVSTNTITGTPTGNVTINAKFHDPITVTWKVGSGAASGGTGEVKYGTAITALPTTPDDDALESCGTNKFMGWSKSELKGTGHDAPADLFTTVGGATALTENTTYRAVFASSTSGAAAGTTIYSEDFSGYSADDQPNGSITNSHTGTTVYGGNTLTYSYSDGSGTTKIYAANLAGGTSPELLIAKYSGYFQIAGIPTGNASVLTLTYKQNGQSITSSVSGTGYSGGKSSSSAGTTTTDITVGTAETFTLTLTGPSGNNNVRLDDILITVKTAGTTAVDYQTGCCEAPASALSITSANSVATGGTVSLTSTGGNGGTVTWSVVNGSGTATVAGTTLTAGSIGTVTVKAHQDANTVLGTEYCAQDAEQAFTVVSSTINVTGVEVSPTTKAIVPGETFDITPTISPSNATDKSVSWTSSASDKASVSSGTVTGVAAGTATITCTTTDGSYTATCAVTVRDVTLQARDEDGNTIAAGGPGAPSRSGATITAAANAGNYVFKQWQVTNASVASTTTTPTTISNPTGAVTVTAVYYKPRVVKWSVNGNDSYTAGGATTAVAYNGTISTVPSDPSGLACASTFVAWTDAAHNNGQTAKDDDSYYESKLFTDAGDFPNITAETTTFYAVFAEGGGAAVNTVMWSEDWTSASNNAKPSQTTGEGTTVYGGGSVTYTESGSDCKIASSDSYAGGTAPELFFSGTQWWNIANIPTGGAATLSLSFKTNQSSRLTVTTTTGNVSIDTRSGSNPYTHTITIGSGVSKFDLKFTSSNNARLDNIDVKVASVSLTNYVTECDANIVKVTYDANGGTTSCTNTTTDKTEDYTVCSTPPTRDYYTFAGWLCSADSKTYAASATIPAAAIDADFTLTAQWTPVTYNISYELDGGTNNVGNPATYNVTTATITLQDPTKGHDRFDGWYDNGSFTGDPITSIPLGSHGNITLYAQWVTRHEIIFDADGVTTTIYRADDEDLSASVAGQGSVPSDPDAPTACSSKVFVGWSESTIDGETDTEPGDLMKPAAGTVNADKHYYAVWATESSESGTVTVFEDALNISGTDAVTSRSGWSTISYVEANSGDGVKLSSKNNAATMTVDLSGKSLESTLIITFQVKQYSDESGYIDFDCLDDGTTASFSPSTISSITDATWTNKTCTVSTVNAATQSITLNGQAKARVYIRNFKITQTGTIYSYSAYSTSCCATKIVLSDPSITDASTSGSTITFDKSSPVFTCDGTKTVTATLTLTAGYQASALSFAVNSGTVSISPAISTPITSSQVYTLTFAEDQNATLTTTATIAAKPLSSITLAETEVTIYDQQYVQIGVTYDPADILTKGYTLVSSPTKVVTTGSTQTQFKISATKAGVVISSETKETVSIKANADNTKTASVEVTILPLPKVHFVDNVHNESFSDVVATLTDNALTDGGVAQTPTHEDFTGSTLNSCEEQHLHLVGWIDGDWTPYKAYMNGTGAKPDEATIMGATGYFYAPGADIDLVAKDGKTYYAVWAKVE